MRDFGAFFVHNCFAEASLFLLYTPLTEIDGMLGNEMSEALTSAEV